MIYLWVEDEVRQVSDDDFELEDRLYHIVFNRKKDYEFLYSEAREIFSDAWGEVKLFSPEDDYYNQVKYKEIEPYVKDIFRVIFK